MSKNNKWNIPERIYTHPCGNCKNILNVEANYVTTSLDTVPDNLIHLYGHHCHNYNLICNNCGHYTIIRTEKISAIYPKKSC